MFFKKTFIEQLIERAILSNAKSQKTILFPETDEKILRACSEIVKRKIATPMLLGRKDAILELFKKYNITNLSEKNIVDYLSDDKSLQDYAKEFIEIRKKDGKKLSLEEAKKSMEQSHFYACMMLVKGLADGMISGINSETKPYLPAFQIVKTREGISRASGIFLMEKDDKLYFFADCALNIDPTSQELSEIALTSADTAINFGVKPKVAMLSFSTHDSAKHALVDKVKSATKIVMKKRPELVVDGEIQFDAAIIPEVAKKKCPDSPLAGEANVLIFPDLNSGNIGYKLVQRLARYRAVGPILQGLNKPVNDLSRGASVQDVVELTAITVVQSL